MGFERPGPSKGPHPFDTLLANAEGVREAHSRQIEIDGQSCDIHWRDSEPDNWTVYIDGLGLGVSKNYDGHFTVTDASPDSYDRVVTERRKGIATKAVRQLFDSEVDKV